jgi:hypothetical protein
MPDKRRLPVLQSEAPEDAAAARRPPWQWVFIGAGFVLTIWVPLMIVGLWLARALAFAPLFSVLVTFAVSCGAAGVLVGRFGGRAREREAALAGLSGGLVACVIALLGGSTPVSMLTPAALALGVLGATMAWLGGRAGVRSRAK